MTVVVEIYADWRLLNLFLRVSFAKELYKRKHRTTYELEHKLWDVLGYVVSTGRLLEHNNQKYFGEISDVCVDNSGL
jgi:hypothetical protein